MAQNKTNVDEYHFKVVLLGDCETGKSAITRQLCKKEYASSYKSTLGIENGIYHTETDQGRARIILLDTSGQERFQNITNSYFSQSQAVVFVYDLSDPASIEKIEARINQVSLRKDCQKLQKILLGNKKDLLDNPVRSTAMMPEETLKTSAVLESPQKIEKQESTVQTTSPVVQTEDKIQKQESTVQTTSVNRQNSVASPMKENGAEKPQIQASNGDAIDLQLKEQPTGELPGNENEHPNKENVQSPLVNENDAASEIAKKYKLRHLKCSAKDRDSLVKVMDVVVNDLIAIQQLKAATSVDDELMKSFKNHPNKNGDLAKRLSEKKVKEDSLQLESSDSPKKRTSVELDSVELDVEGKPKTSMTKKVGCGCTIF